MPESSTVVAKATGVLLSLTSATRVDAVACAVAFVPVSKAKPTPHLSMVRSIYVLQHQSQAKFGSKDARTHKCQDHKLWMAAPLQFVNRTLRTVHC